MKFDATKALGIYIHIPFCRSKCDYCDFYSLAGREGYMDAYQKALIAHLAETAPRARGLVVDTVYFGGGTPSYYGAKRLVRLLKTIRSHFRLWRDAEITLEANPDSVDTQSLTELRHAGFNRISLGMQSACDAQLADLHRPHAFGQVNLAVKAARRAGFDNLSLDLIYGLPGQSMDSWLDTLEKALSLAPRHLSCYALTVEKGTPLARRVGQGLILPDDDAQADMYLQTVDRLARAGYEQYEISNFALPGFASRHNLRYWQMRPYLGFGPGAHSDFGQRRYSFVRDLDAYISGVTDGGSVIDFSDLIPLRERSGEYLMLSLRTAAGISPEVYRRDYHMDFAPLEEKLLRYEQRGWAQRTGDGWRLTPTGFLISNRLIGELLERQTPLSLEAMLPKK